LQNLVHNSAHASAQNAQIEIGVRKEGNYAVLSVKDHGHGIPVELRGKVFQPNVTTKPGTGTGLGLAIVKHLTEARNGAVDLASSDAGTLIQIKIPVFKNEGGEHVV
jgi:signal transduction histidine kinase